MCRCSIEQVQRYRGRVSGPLLDRFDLHIALPSITIAELETLPPGESSEVVRARVTQARQRQEQRALKRAALVQPSLDELAAELEPRALALLHRTLSQLELSLRAYSKILKVSRTIADLAGSDAVRIPHVAEAVQYRLLDRERSDLNPSASRRGAGVLRPFIPPPPGGVPPDQEREPLATQPRVGLPTR